MPNCTNEPCNTSPVRTKILYMYPIVASQHAQSHTCTLYFATFTPGGKSGNARLISGPMVTYMRNGYMKAAEMGPFYILVREEKASRIPHRHSKVRGHRPEVRVSRGGRQTTSSIILVLYPAYSEALIGIARLQSPKSHSPVRRAILEIANCELQVRSSRQTDKHRIICF